MTTEARSARDLMGMPVYSVAEGERIGSVSALLVRRQDRAVEVIGISGGAFRQPRYLRLSQVNTIGADAVMVPSAAVLQEALTGSETQELDDSLAGRPVVSESGQRLGEIAGFTVTPSSGKIHSYRVRPEAAGLARLAALLKPDIAELPDTLVVALGANALIVRDEAMSLWQREEAGAQPPEGGQPAS